MQPDLRHRFPYVLSTALALITALYVAFGLSGYVSFGEHTEKIITLNMPPGSFPLLIKSCLCFSLYFTYPGEEWCCSPNKTKLCM